MKLGVCVFAYKRPIHTRQMLDSLFKNEGIEEIPITYYVDAPKLEIDRDLVQQTIRCIEGFLRKIDRLVVHSRNQGLKKSVIDGVSAALERFDAVIVLEDDLVLSSAFISAMKAGVRCAERDSQIAQVSGHSYLNDLPSQDNRAFIKLHLCCTWGWAINRDSWFRFMAWLEEAPRVPRTLSFMASFDYYLSYPYTRILHAAEKGNASSWGIYFNYYMHLNGLSTIYSPTNLVGNNGYDGSGTNCGKMEASRYVFQGRAVSGLLTKAVEPGMWDRSRVSWSIAYSRGFIRACRDWLWRAGWILRVVG